MDTFKSCCPNRLIRIKSGILISLPDSFAYLLIDCENMRGQKECLLVTSNSNSTSNCSNPVEKRNFIVL